MKKKKGGGGGANWMDTYGDMVTLLLCFFVLLYSMSTISEENWKALVMSFNPDAALSTTVTPGGDGPNADANEGGGPISATMEISQELIDSQMEELYQALKEYVSQEGAQSSISVTKGDGKVYVSFNNSVFFEGDKAELMESSKPILDTICGMLDSAVQAIDEVRIMGHTAQGTPDEPNNPQTDRTLSSNRAANVVVYIQMNSQIDPARLISEGYGQWRPVADNDTEEGRSKNRRVEMVVSGRNLDEELAGSIQQYSTDE